MAEYGAESLSIAALALTRELIEMLEHKGVISTNEKTSIYNAAIVDINQNKTPELQRGAAVLRHLLNERGSGKAGG